MDTLHNLGPFKNKSKLYNLLKFMYLIIDHDIKMKFSDYMNSEGIVLFERNGKTTGINMKTRDKYHNIEVIVIKQY